MLNLPRLSIVDTKNLITHEKEDFQRTPPLIKSLEKSGYLKNPPIVTLFPGSTTRYFVLDGANRVTAFRQMGFPYIIAQVVESDDPGLKLEPWKHIYWGLDPNDILKNIKAIGDINIEIKSNCSISPKGISESPLVRIKPDEKTDFLIDIDSRDIRKRTEVLNEIVLRYQKSAKIDRTTISDYNALHNDFPQMSGIVYFPRYRIDQVLHLVDNGYLLPPGITRFTISPRILHINYPLRYLEGSLTKKEAEKMFRRWLEKLLEQKRIRYYEESTFLFND